MIRRAKGKKCEFEPEWTRGIAVKSLAIWALRDEKRSEAATRCYIRSCGWLPVEARWAVKAAREWLEAQKRRLPAPTKEDLRRLLP